VFRGYDLRVTNRLARIGLISDTHGLLREEAVETLRGSRLILHAGSGEAGDPGELRKVAPVVAVRAM